MYLPPMCKGRMPLVLSVSIKYSEVYDITTIIF